MEWILSVPTLNKIKIRTNDNIRGIYLDCEIKLLHYADDTTGGLNSDDSLKTLRATVCKYRESGVSREIFNFFTFCPNNLYSELFLKILFKGPEAL